MANFVMIGQAVAEIWRIMVFTRASLALRGISHHRVSVCVSMCLALWLCVTRRYCIKTAECRTRAAVRHLGFLKVQNFNGS